MEKLNELVELAKELGGESWEYRRTTSYSRGYITAQDGRNILQTTSGEVPANVCQFIEMADPETILAIAEEFRVLEQDKAALELKAANLNDGWLNAINDRDEARAKLAELEKQQAVGVARMEMAIGKEGLRHYQCFVDMRPDLVVAEINTGMELFTRPAPAADLVPEGWKLVPIEPTEYMIISGFESEPDEALSEAENWDKYEAMSGCQQAAYKAELCWAAMLAAAPEVE
ncbi:hypothetical protein [Pantoea agglomerans]|uniref:hypothetical protein n=1 Tax=Enterobacter agglomerans TaxID=549 RepID=UPI00301DB0D4